MREDLTWRNDYVIGEKFRKKNMCWDTTAPSIPIF
jgi:hypothetical protein